jgi:hypothetical protein
MIFYIVQHRIIMEWARTLAQRTTPPPLFSYFRHTHLKQACIFAVTTFSVGMPVLRYPEAFRSEVQGKETQTVSAWNLTDKLN